MLVQLFRNLYLRWLPVSRVLSPCAKATVGPKATSSRACSVSAGHGFTNKEKGSGRCRFYDQDLPNKSLCTGIVQHSQNDFSMGLVSLNSLHMMCRVDLCRERVWGFNTSGKPSYPFKLAHWHSGARIIVLNLSNLGRQRKYSPINSAVQCWSRRVSPPVQLLKLHWCSCTWCVCGV